MLRKLREIVLNNRQLDTGIIIIRERISGKLMRYDVVEEWGYYKKKLTILQHTEKLPTHFLF